MKAKMKAEVRSYEDALKFLDGKSQRIIGHNTELVINGKGIAVQFYGHDIVTYHVDGIIKLDTCGYATVSTKNRFNDFIPLGTRVVCKRGVWWIERPRKNFPGLGDRRVYHDGSDVSDRPGRCLGGFMMPPNTDS